MLNTGSYVDVPGTPYSYERSIRDLLQRLQNRVDDLRSAGKLSPEALRLIRKYFKVKNIYHSNAIEGNQLDYGETRLVVEEGLTISGKPLKDSKEAKNLSGALDFFEELVNDTSRPLGMFEIRQIHALILKEIDDENAGKYRGSEIQISGSQYESPSHIKVPAMMDEFAFWLNQVSTIDRDTIDNPTNAIIVAAIAHAWFVYIHLFIDGNGRTARIIMNLMLMRYSYPICIITRDDRGRYIDALETSQAGDITAFISLISDGVSESLDEYERAADTQRENDEWAKQLTSKFKERRSTKLRGEFEVWHLGMDLLKSRFQQIIESLNEYPGAPKVEFFAYDVIDFDKYLSLREKISAKRTWFFKIHISIDQRIYRYLFFFGFASFELDNQLPDGVTVHTALETNPFFHEKLDRIRHISTPDLLEVGYLPREEKFLCRFKHNRIETQRVEEFGRYFIRQAFFRAVDAE